MIRTVSRIRSSIRADLRRTLYEEAEAQGARIVLGAKIDAEATDFPDAVIRQANSEEQLKANLVIGADGAQSMCRAALLQQRPNRHFLRPTGTIVNRIVIDPESMQKNSLLDNQSPVAPKYPHLVGARRSGATY
ncbi:hypothetical protein VTN00DRAFT_7413 [Thermoascus crustaceus]|uniref:uncharacterized protein n=1 Tax=Thermoascus crustaceus TaxID=5088 RepID=UPI0037426837